MAVKECRYCNIDYDEDDPKTSSSLCSYCIECENLVQQLKDGPDMDDMDEDE